MKLEINKNKNNTADKTAPAAKTVVKAKTPAKPETAKTPAIKAKLSTEIALISGKRGFAARFVEVSRKGTEVSIRALQNNSGLAMKDGKFAKIENGILTGEKQALLELGCYVNGRMTGAKCELLTAEQFAKRSKPAIIHWNADDNGVQCRYIGDPNQKGMCAVVVNYGKTTYYWQMEQDSNSHNRHERGGVKPQKDGVKLEACK